MLMVRMYGHRQWKILGKAEIYMSVLTDYMVPEFGEKYHDKQIKKIDEEKICYNIMRNSLFR